MPDFMVTYRVRGTSTRVITAENLEEAEAEAELLAEKDGYEALLDMDELTEYDMKVQRLHLVERNGRRLKVTYVLTGDIRLDSTDTSPQE